MCMVYDDSENVLVQNRLSPDWPGITFPGGHVDTGESFTDAAIREVFEETGLTISELEMCGIKDRFRDDGTRYVVLLIKPINLPVRLCHQMRAKYFGFP